MNKVLNSIWLTRLSSTSSYIEYYKKLIILSDSIPYAKAPNLLFPITLYQERFFNLCVDDFINIWLDRFTDDMCNSTRCFNIIMNTFDVFFNKSLTNILNRLKRLCTLSLQKLSRKVIPSEVKKILG